MKKQYPLKKALFICFLALSTQLVLAQDEKTNKGVLDSLFIEEVENQYETDKVLHAEPLYIDLIRDLGARKGEKEWNLGMGLTDNVVYDSYEALIEYEFAPIDHFGLEVELPFTFYSPLNGTYRDSIPSDRLESLKLACQWSFFVNEKIATSMALGYIHEFLLVDFDGLSDKFYRGNVFNPFFIAAKRWGSNFHTLLYTGPVIEKPFDGAKTHTHFQINSNVHFMIPGTRNFIGIEVNQELHQTEMFTVLRPQMRVAIADNFMVGIVTGIPIDRKEERLSTFLRLIWEPGHPAGFKD